MLRVSTKGLGVFLLATMTVACSKGNPLMDEDEKKLSAALYHSSEKASVALGKSVYESGGFYSKCMQEKEDKSFCGKLYTKMAEAMEKEGYKVSVGDITDKKLFKKIEPELARTASFLG